MNYKSLLLALSVFLLTGKLSAQDADPVLMTIEGKEIYQSEFEYLYNKSNAVALEKKNVDEYLELFTQYKLKVAAAEAIGLDTLPAFKKELNSYRRKLAASYLTDKKLEGTLVKEAYDRLKENIELSYILVDIDSPGMASDTLKAYKRAMRIYNKALKEKDFNALAFNESDDPNVKKNKGYVGYITGFMIPYPIETAVYALSKGEISKPIRFNNSYFLFKVTDRCPDRGEFLAQHILKLVAPHADQTTQDRVKQTIDQLYEQIKAGEDFQQLAQKESDDSGSASNGGELPWFGTGRMIKVFEDKVVALGKGEISEPFRSDFGWHIVKLVDKRSLPPFEEMQIKIQQHIKNDVRKNAGKRAKTEDLKKTYTFTPKKESYDRLYQMANNDYPFDSIFTAELRTHNDVLFELDGNSYDLSAFADYLDNRSTPSAVNAMDAMQEKLEEFEQQTILDYENSHLEEKHPEFAHLINEYRDGMLLFEIVNQEVWGKSVKDKKALQEYFEKNKGKYKWKKKHYKGYIIQCADKNIAKEIKRSIKKIPTDSLFSVLYSRYNTPRHQKVRITKGVFEQGKNPIVDKLAYKKKGYIPDSLLPIAFLHGKNLKYTPESYTDVRTDMTMDFQNYLEKKWIDSLVKNFSVKINKKAVEQLKKQ